MQCRDVKAEAAEPPVAEPNVRKAAPAPAPAKVDEADVDVLPSDSDVHPSGASLDRSKSLVLTVCSDVQIRTTLCSRPARM
jgi:hypothetical protein